jgi:hypothetical protein
MSLLNNLFGSGAQNSILGTSEDEMYRNHMDHLRAHEAEMIRQKYAAQANQYSQQLAQSMAQDLYQNRTQTIQALQAINQIDRQTAEDLQWQAGYEADMISKLYTPINDENLQSAIQQYGASQIYTNAFGQSYLKPQTTPEERAVVMDWISKYSDVDIQPTDTLNQARAKIVNSKFYKQATRLSGGGGGTAEGTFKVGNEVIQETGDTFQDTVNYLKSLRNQNLLTDYAYEEKITALMQNIEADPSRRDEIQSAVNSAMEGGTVEDVSELVVDNVVDSWISDTPYASQGLGTFGTDPKTFGKELVNATQVPGVLNWAGNLSKKASKYLTGK